MVDQAAGQSAPVARGTALYQSLLVSLLSLNFGILFFDRNALNFLMPFVKPELGLTNTQVGLTASALSFSWALSAMVVGAAADRSGKRKMFLIGATLAFSLCSFLSGLASSFLMLFAARLLMGAVEGGVMPVSHTMIAVAVSPERRGVAMGIAQNFGSNLFGSFIAPVVLVWFATKLNWHSAFYIAGVPGIASAVLLWFFIDEPRNEPDPAMAERPNLLQHFSGILTSRNMILCVLISILLVSYLVVCWAFMPLFLTQTRGFSPITMSWLMGTLGLSATIGSFLVAGLSDRIGRKPVMIVTAFMGVILPLGAIYYVGSVWVLAAIFFVGWALTGIFPLFMATVPSESVGHERLATAIALVVGIGEVFGGVLSPAIAGKVADLTDMSAPLWIMAGLCVGAGLLAIGLRETAPAVLKAKAG